MEISSLFCRNATSFSYPMKDIEKWIAKGSKYIFSLKVTQVKLKSIFIKTT